ncbi:MAG: TrkA family potassium uptake protein [Armatimonadetes bacterium]|nr:TrkA family potassium uptake protein [Armatimonadota bacterium]
MRIVILGCGRVGATVATTMCRDGHYVTIIDKSPDSFRRLTADFTGRQVLGNGIDEETMQEAEVDKADAFLAVTNGDNRNIMSVQMAKVRFNVPRVVARIYDPNRAFAYSELGIETICTTCVGAGLMRDLILGRPFGDIHEYTHLGQEGPENE